RRLRAPLALGPYTVPPGLAVGANVYLTHRRADTYAEPGSFLPERFLDGAPGPGSWVPFGGGIRRCLGASFATFEIGAVLRTVIESARLRPASSRPEGVRLHAI